MNSRDLALLAFALSAAAPAAGQTIPESPAAVADSFLSRMARKDFLGATELVDSTSMEDFRVSRIESAPSEDSLQKRTRQRRTDVPPAVAEWLEATARNSRDAYGSYLERELGVSTLAELERLTAREVFARWLAARHPETEFERMRDMSDDPRVSELPSLAVKGRAPLLLGTVTATDSLAYAVFHDSESTGPLPAVLPVRLTSGGWRIPAGDAEMAIVNGICSISFAIVDADEVP